MVGGCGWKVVIVGEETRGGGATKKGGRPAKGASDRTEAVLSPTAGREHVTHAERALDKKGRILGLRVNTKANLGAYL